jgi:hypothetical protein
MSYSYEFSSSNYEETNQAPSVSVRLGQSALSRGDNNNSSNNHRSTVSFASNNPNQNYNAYNAVSASAAMVTSQSVISGSVRTAQSSRAATAASNAPQYSYADSAVINETASSATPVGYLSEIEQAVLRSNVPLEIAESEEITVLGQRGIWANRAEVVNWRGAVPIDQYVINEDAKPEIITKRTQQRIE